MTLSWYSLLGLIHKKCIFYVHGFITIIFSSNFLVAKVIRVSAPAFPIWRQSTRLISLLRQRYDISQRIQWNDSHASTSVLCVRRYQFVIARRVALDVALQPIIPMNSYLHDETSYFLMLLQCRVILFDIFSYWYARFNCVEVKRVAYYIANYYLQLFISILKRRHLCLFLGILCG